jgi:hypothetical protein
MLVLPVQRSGYQAAGGPQVNFACFYGLWCRLHRWVTPISCIIYTTAQKPCQDYFVKSTYIFQHPVIIKWSIRQIWFKKPSESHILRHSAPVYPDVGFVEM